MKLLLMRWLCIFLLMLQKWPCTSESQTCQSIVAGPCTLERIPLSHGINTPLSQPVVFYHDDAQKPTRNTDFAQLVERNALLSRLGSEQVKLTSSNAYSDGEVIISLQDYIDLMDIQSSNACGTANESLYLFGGNYSPGWTSLIEEYILPGCRTCKDPADNAAVSFGVGSYLSGVSWHRHGAGFSEVFHGSKRWFLLPPDGPIGMGSFNANLSVASWVNNGLENIDREASGLLECTIYPGDVLYFPPFWPHATLNLDSYTSFASTFLIIE